MAIYTIGIDFGTRTARAVLVNASNGTIKAAAEADYPHGVIEKKMPNGQKLPDEWALQYPRDYFTVLQRILPDVCNAVPSSEIKGIGIDCTSCTVLPILADGTPLCMTEAFANEPLAWVLLWKHHGAADQAKRLTQAAAERNEPWLNSYGGTINAEMFLPKLLQVYEEAPEVYQEAAYFIEALDWIPWLLTGNLVRSEAAANMKLFRQNGQYPAEDYLNAVSPGFGNVIHEKLSLPLLGPCEQAGCVSEKASRWFHLPAGIPVCVGHVDAQVCLPAAGIHKPGEILCIQGTSGCEFIMDPDDHHVSGISGAVPGTVLPEYYTYESGQSAVGDIFRWFEKESVPEHIVQEAKRNQMSIQGYLTSLAEKITPTPDGIVALDWWNGNRSILADANLKGVMTGLTLHTEPQHIYRALLEAVAFGTCTIIRHYHECGVKINKIYATGGVAFKNELFIRICATVMKMPVYIVETAEGSALGSAIYGAVAAGLYPTMEFAIVRMGCRKYRRIDPCDAEISTYEILYSRYKALHDLFSENKY